MNLVGTCTNTLDRRPKSHFLLITSTCMRVGVSLGTRGGRLGSCARWCGVSSNGFNTHLQYLQKRSKRGRTLTRTRIHSCISIHTTERTIKMNSKLEWRWRGWRQHTPPARRRAVWGQPCSQRGVPHQAQAVVAVRNGMDHKPMQSGSHVEQRSPASIKDLPLPLEGL